MEEEGTIYEEEILAADDGRIVDEFAKSLLKFVLRQQAEVLHTKFAKFLRKIISRQQAHDVPADLVANFLMNMRVESVYTFRKVSRLWLSTISSPAFLREHYHHSTKYLSNYRIVYRCANKKYGYHLRSFDLQSVLNGEPIGGYPIPANNTISIVGTCHGTVCVGKYGVYVMQKVVALVSPCIWKCQNLPLEETKFSSHNNSQENHFSIIRSTL